MKNLQKVFAALLCLALVFSLAACGSQGGGDAEDNTAPEISGVMDQAVEAGASFDAFAGVTASDKEDGDLSDKIVITSMPEISFSNGKATVADPGDYELTYTVTDKAGAETKAYATLTVTRQTAEAVVYKDLDFNVGESD